MRIKLVGGYSLNEVDELLKRNKKEVVNVTHENNITVLELV